MALTLLAAPALGARPIGGCPPGPTQTGTADIAGWQLWDQTTFAAAIEDSGFDPADAEAVYAAEDKNNDGYLCVLVQVLPNDASGSDTWFVSKDNTSR